jgi:hypothetical protein
MSYMHKKYRTLTELGSRPQAQMTTDSGLITILVLSNEPSHAQFEPKELKLYLKRRILLVGVLVKATNLKLVLPVASRPA